jgi:tetratricopeptide (TPR) repeat protein
MAGTRLAQVSEVDCANHHHGQARLQVCTLASTNMILGRLDSVQTEMTAQFQQMLTMLQQGQVRQRSRSLSVHSQVEPVGFNSQTTRVGDHTPIRVQTDGYHTQVVANTTTSIVTFSILSPDTSLSYDRIKLCLEEYRTLLASDSDTIELSTENGKTVICGKQANEIEEYLDRAELLLRDVVQSRDTSTLVVLHNLRDLTRVLDNLKLYDECRLTGNCALDFAEAMGRSSLEFRQEHAETLGLIAGLSVYRPRARTLFIQAISICEEVAENNASHSNKHRLFMMLGIAGSLASDHLGAQWLGRAVELMTKELPQTMVHPLLRSNIYHNYGVHLKEYPKALEAYREALSICRALFNEDPAKHNYPLAQTLMNMGAAYTILGRYDDAIAACEESLQISGNMAAQDPLRYNEMIAQTLVNYGCALGNINQLYKAAAIEKEAVSILRNLVQTGNECTKSLCDALENYGRTCHSLGRHAEAVLAFQESIRLLRALAATESEAEKQLVMTLHNIVTCFLALDMHAEASIAANETLESNHGRVFEDCRYAPDFSACFVCRRGIIPDSPEDVSSPLPVSEVISSP